MIHYCKNKIQTEVENKLVNSLKYGIQTKNK